MGEGREGEGGREGGREGGWSGLAALPPRNGFPLATAHTLHEYLNKRTCAFIQDYNYDLNTHTLKPQGLPNHYIIHVAITTSIPATKGHL